jgi:anti-anti-sigma factor
MDTRVTPAGASQALVLTVDGVVDVATRGGIRAELCAALAELPPPDVVVVDLTDVAFFTAAGLHLLAELAELAARRGLGVRVVAAPGTVAALAIGAGGFDELPVFGDIGEALDQ